MSKSHKRAIRRAALQRFRAISKYMGKRIEAYTAPALLGDAVESEKG